MDKKKLGEIFRNNSNCYADTFTEDDKGNFIEGDVILAMTEERFIQVVTDFVLNDKRNVQRGEEKLAETKKAINNAINRGISDRSFFNK